MARKVIDYDEWLRTRTLVEARAKRILSFFDMDKLKRKPREAGKEAWLRAHNQASRFAPAGPFPPKHSAKLR
jgi:hypothetical protein